MSKSGKASASMSVKRVLVYVLGIIVLALGITLNTKTGLGVSPVISVAYCATEITGIQLSMTTFIWYCVLIALQALLLGRNFKIYQLLQVICSFLTSGFIGIYDAVIPAAENIAVRLILLLTAIIVTAFGIILTVGMNIVPNPADGFASVLGQKLKRGLGFGKNILDLGCIVISVTVGLIVVRHLVGIGIGTIVTMLLTGRAVAVMNRLFGKKVTAIAEQND